MVFGKDAPLGDVVKLRQSNKVLRTQNREVNEYHLSFMDQLFKSQLSGISSNQPIGNCAKHQIFCSWRRQTRDPFVYGKMSCWTNGLQGNVCALDA